MPATPGLVPNLRLDQPTEELSPDDVIVEILEDDGTDFSGAANLMEIEHPDGSISISLDGRPIIEDEERDTSSWFRNLADEIDTSHLNLIASDLLDGIRDDIDSRKDWIEDRAQGVKLLGLKIEVPNTQGSPDGTRCCWRLSSASKPTPAPRCCRLMGL